MHEHRRAAAGPAPNQKKFKRRNLKVSGFQIGKAVGFLGNRFAKKLFRVSAGLVVCTAVDSTNCIGTIARSTERFR
jgi:hypothetical protein